ncbi:MAG TPA: GPW/gp25 family protein [candidate division Zixibacteria bacterium]|nr:GPW/gp25 family protein [candidate division Zixibacteria bacterium]
MNTDFLGKGFAFPMQINSQGGINVSSQEKKIKESILIILGTQYGERVMRPKFGCNLKSLLFAPNNTGTANLARHYVEEGLTRWESRIILDEVIVENDYSQGRLMIHIQYRIKSTNEPGNLVYPFYLEQK